MEIIEMLADYAEFVTVEGTHVQVHDFKGFDDDWCEIMVDLPEELEIIIDDLIELGYDVNWDGEDI